MQMGTLCMTKTVVAEVPTEGEGKGHKENGNGSRSEDSKRRQKQLVLVPIQFQSDVQRMHLKAGFDKQGM